MQLPNGGVQFEKLGAGVRRSFTVGHQKNLSEARSRLLACQLA